MTVERTIESLDWLSRRVGKAANGLPAPASGLIPGCANPDSPPVFVRLYSGLYMVRVTPEQARERFHYRYIVQAPGGLPHTAFRTREGLDLWLALRGLWLQRPSPDDETHDIVPVEGSYRTASHMGADAFYSLPAFQLSRVMSNGRYTLAVFTCEDDGLVTEHTLNPNVERVVFDWRRSDERRDAGLL